MSEWNKTNHPNFFIKIEDGYVFLKEVNEILYPITKYGLLKVGIETALAKEWILKYTK